MDKVAEIALKQRTKELERQSWVSGAEAECLKMSVGENKRMDYFDAEAYQRLRTRLFRNKQNTGKIYSTSLDGDIITITRFEDEY